MNAKEEIQKTLLTEPIKLAIKPILGFVGLALTPFLLYTPSVYRWLADRIPFWLMLGIAIIEFLLLLATGAYLVYLSKKLKSLSKYDFHFGVFWDSKNDPRCPADTTHLTASHSTTLYCTKCGKHITLRNDAGQPISIQHAKESLSKLIQPPSKAAASLPTENQPSAIKKLPDLSTLILCLIAHEHGGSSPRQFLYEDIQEERVIIDHHINQLMEDEFLYQYTPELIPELSCTAKGTAYVAEWLVSNRTV